MAVAPLSREQMIHLADDVKRKLLAEAARVAVAEGEITVRIYRKGQGFEIKLTTTA